MAEWGIKNVPRRYAGAIAAVRCLACGAMVAVECWPSHPRACPVSRLTRAQAYQVLRKLGVKDKRVGVAP